MADDNAPDLEWRARFEALVLRWIQTHQDSKAVAIVKISSYGTDWDGDTEVGFYSSFRVDVTYQRADGTKRTADTDGESMGSLWLWVMNGGETNG